MSYNPDSFKTKLSNVAETQDSITSLSQWIIFHKRHADTSARVWAQYAVSEAPQKLHLALVYVANEVVQQSRARRKEEFVDAFGAVIPDTLAAIYDQASKEVRDRLLRVVKVWRDRSIFPADVQAQIEAKLKVPTAASSGSSSQGTSLGVAAELEPAVRLFGKYVASRDAATAANAQLQKDYTNTFDSESSPAPKEYLQKVTALEGLATKAANAVETTKGDRERVIEELQQLILKLSGISDPTADIIAKQEQIAETKNDLKDLVDGDSALGSPSHQSSNAETEEYAPQVPQVSNPAPENEEYVPSVYTAKDAEAGYDKGSDDENVGYAAGSDEDEDEPEPKKPKLDLDPKLASFLATMAGK